MCSRSTIEALLTGAVAALRHSRDAESGQSKADAEKIERTLTSLQRYERGQRPVLPEHRPVGPLTGSQTLLEGAL